MRAKHIFLSTAALLPAAFVSSPLAAQSITLDPPPVSRSVDEQGVDLATGEAVSPSSSVAIGGKDGLVHSRSRVANGWRHNYIWTIVSGPAYSPALSRFTVNIGGNRVSFLTEGSYFWPENGTHAGKLVTTANGYLYTTADGVEYSFETGIVAQNESYYGPVTALGVSRSAPDGRKTELHYRGDSYLAQGLQVYTVRLQSVTNNASFQLKFDYAADTPTEADGGDSWYEISKVTAINQSEEYCNPTADSCSLATNWPHLSYSTSTSGADTVETVTDILGRQSSFREDANGKLIGYKRPSENVDGVTFVYGADGRVASASRQNSQTRTYTWSAPLPTELVATSTDALGRSRTTSAHSPSGQIEELTDALGNKTTFEYGPDRQIDKITYPEGNRVEYTRDIAERITETRVVAKPGSNEPDIVTTASYPALVWNQQQTVLECANFAVCTKPTSTTDARGQTTDYTYDPVHGGVLTVQLPPDQNGVRPKTTIAYAAENARIKNAAGNLVIAANPITKPVSVKRCRVGAACSGSANEQVVEVDYDNLQAPNLQPVTVIRKAGDGTLASAASYTYDHLGNVETVDGPLPGTVDLAKSRYDAAGQLTGTISPDPDGTTAGNKHLATRLTYNDDGQITQRENGYVNGLTEADWTNFAGDTRSITTYDEFGRTKTEAHVFKTTVAQYSITQYGYDSAGRLECVAQRMNAPTSNTVLPADACTPMTAGAFGEDRIAKRIYDAADRVVEVRSAVGTSHEQITAEMAYTDNGQLAWVEDAMSNRTAYTQDGFDRNIRINYPDPAASGTASSTDYEAITYDAGGNILTHRTRRNETFSYAYDNLGRVTQKIVPNRTGLSTTHTRDVYFSYDLFGGLTSATFDSASGEGLSFAYNALGQVTGATTDLDGQVRTIAYDYDVAGRRTKTTHPDGAHWTNVWDNLGRLTNIKDPSGINLVSNIFWPGGQLRRMSRDLSAPDVDYLMDPGKRLNRMFTNHPNNAYDLNHTWTLNAAGQVEDESLSNALFAGHALPTSDLDYVSNGLNQYTNIDGFTQSYDLNGNLSISRQSDGNGGTTSTTYTYDPENRLVAASGEKTATLRYDPFGRLYEVTDAQGGKTRFHYDGDALIGEYNASGTLLQRYVHGPSSGDDPLIRYAGSSTARADARFLYSDRLGSIIQEVANNGTQTALNSYDPYGVPGPTSGINNIGRFRYTGQVWLEELGMYYYKARMYSPTLGRFMQTDPIGYSDGMNMQAYVGNDPVNYIDPTGLNEIVVNGGGCPEGDPDEINVCGSNKPLRIFCDQTYNYGQCAAGNFRGLPGFDGFDLRDLIPDVTIVVNARQKACVFAEFIQETSANLADYSAVGAVVAGGASLVTKGSTAPVAVGLVKASGGFNALSAGAQFTQDILVSESVPTSALRLSSNVVPGLLVNRLRPSAPYLDDATAALAGMGVEETVSALQGSFEQWNEFNNPKDQCGLIGIE